MFIDTHSHIYLDEFDCDRLETIERAKNAGIEKIVLPNVDTTTIDSLVEVASIDKTLFYTANGLHPTSVNADYRLQLENTFADETMSRFPNLVAVGEIGIDLFWDTTFLKEQKEVFDFQLSYAKEHALPIIIHCRNGFSEIIDVLTNYRHTNLTGVFHCFSEDYQAAKLVLDMGYYLGIGGVLTYKKSLLPEIVSKVPISRLLLETDSPYLAPVPKRGKRNEPAYTVFVAQKIAELHNLSLEDVALTTTNNAKALFGI